MIYTRQLHVWAVRDKLGDVHIALSEETSDDIYIEGSIDERTTKIFESDAYHLEDWCKTHGFGYFHGLQDITVEVRF